MVEITSNLEVVVDDLETEIRITLMAGGGPVYDDLLERGKAVKAEIRRLILDRAKAPSFGPGGGLAESLEGDISRDLDDEWIVTISSNLPQAIWFEEGTGLFGPRHAFIFPRGKFMVFTPRGSASRVIAFKVKGQEGQHPFRDGLAAFD